MLRDKKSSVSYVQRRLSVGYNKAASLIERMEKDGILGPASHTGKREILAHSRGRVISGVPMATRTKTRHVIPGLASREPGIHFRRLR